MDFTLTEEQEAIRKVARQIFDARATKDALERLDAGDLRFDAEMWGDLADADLLGIALPESVGGSGHGFLEVCVVLSEGGWAVAPAPAFPTLVLGAAQIGR